MDKKIIAKLVTERQVEQLHRLMDHGYDNLTFEDRRLLDKLIQLSVYAAHQNALIELKKTDRIVLNNVVFIDRARINREEGSVTA